MFQYEQEYENEIKPKWNLSSNKERKELEEFRRELKERKQAKIQAKLKADKANSPQEKEAKNIIAKDGIVSEARESEEDYGVVVKGKKEPAKVKVCKVKDGVDKDARNNEEKSEGQKNFYQVVQKFHQGKIIY